MALTSSHMRALCLRQVNLLASRIGEEQPDKCIAGAVDPYVLSGRDGEKRPTVNAAGAQRWPANADPKRNGETENARNVGQLGTCGRSDAVNKLRGKRCEVRVWLPERNRVPEWT
jgi:hypothetical protein